jgi:DNA-binding XRE family transcriptional regulator
MLVVYVQASTLLRKHLCASKVLDVPPPTSPDRDLAAVLRARRERDGRSQEALAHDAGITVTSLARIERGQANPTWTTVRSIAQALGITLVQLARAVEKHGGG